MSDEQKLGIITDPLQPETGRQAQIGTDIPFQEPPKKAELKNDKPAKDEPKKDEPKKEPPPAKNDHFDVDTGGTAKIPIQQP